MSSLSELSTFQIIAAVAIGVISVARTARLIVWDEYPPMVWLRMKWDERIGEEGWGKLIHCQFCATPYLAVGMALWFWLAFAHGGDVAQGIWWWVNGVWAGSYVAAIVVAYDDGA